MNEDRDESLISNLYNLQIVGHPEGLLLSLYPRLFIRLNSTIQPIIIKRDGVQGQSGQSI
jgi:hypothetical protein